MTNSGFLFGILMCACFQVFGQGQTTFSEQTIDEARKELLSSIETDHLKKMEVQASLDKVLLEEEKLQLAIQQPDKPKDELKRLSAELKQVKSKRKELKREVKNLEKKVGKYSKAVYGDPNKMVLFFLDEREKEIESTKILESEPLTEEYLDVEAPNEPKEDIILNQDNPVSKTVSNNRPPVQAFDADKDTYQNPPKAPCAIAVSRFDEIAGIDIVETKKSFFFGMTSDQLRPFIKGRDYLECYGNIIAGEGGLLSLTMEFKIASVTAQREYGLLEKNNIVTIKLVNDKTYKFFCTRTDRGEVNPATKVTTYKTQFKIPINHKKELMTTPIDKVRVVWSTGYEDYEVYEVDFLMNHLSCLDQKGL